MSPVLRASSLSFADAAVGAGAGSVAFGVSVSRSAGKFVVAVVKADDGAAVLESPETLSAVRFAYALQSTFGTTNGQVWWWHKLNNCGLL